MSGTFLVVKPTKTSKNGNNGICLNRNRDCLQTVIQHDSVRPETVRDNNGTKSKYTINKKQKDNKDSFYHPEIYKDKFHAAKCSRLKAEEDMKFLITLWYYKLNREM